MYLPGNGNIYIAHEDHLPMVSRTRSIAYIIAFILFSFPVLGDERNLYFYDSLELELSVDGEFRFVAQGDNPRIEEATTQLFLHPSNDFRQRIISLESEGTAQGGSLLFRWINPPLGKQSFGYAAHIRTEDKRVEVPRKIPFPINEDNVQGIEEYLLPTETIDSTNPAIIAKASELVEGEDDLFKVVFRLASWVDQNVDYELNTVTEKASQKASWVLQHRQGVCDEMTSLFIAMARAVGIPARFVSGISYTSSPLFDYPWQPHGWAEVFFPGIGWVSFDITFGEYGYIDGTHIKLRESADPQEPATRYQWRAHTTGIETEDLEMEVAVRSAGRLQPETIQLEQEILAPEVGKGSYNLIKGIVKNSKEYYAATTLRLAVPDEVEIVGNNKRTILLLPEEVRETFWTIRLPDNLDENYIYTFPSVIYSEKNASVHGQFVVREEGPVYTRRDIERLTVQDEEKSYSRKIGVDCEYAGELKLGQQAEISCTAKNRGNTNLYGVDFCLEGICDRIDLPINQEQTRNITIIGEEPGQHSKVVSVENALVEKKILLSYVVVEDPVLATRVEYPGSVFVGEPIPFVVHLHKETFNVPQDVVITIKGLGAEYRGEIEEVRNNETISLTMAGKRVAGRNTITIITQWKDQEGRAFSEQQKAIIVGRAESLDGKIRLILNRILNIFR